MASFSSSFQPHTIFEPFKIKSVEEIHHTTLEERQLALEGAYYNPFLLKADDVMIDLLTDSGTGAMSKLQYAGMMVGDESYAGSSSYYKLESTIKKITGFKHIITTHQGRAAERILFESIPLRAGNIVPNNTHFDTTRANVEYRQAKAVDIVIKEGHQPSCIHPFKGNIDLVELERVLSSSHSESAKHNNNKNNNNVPLVMITITNNSGGGQPVSMANIRATSQLCHQYHNVAFFLDACRFAENAYFIKLREEGYSSKSILEIVQEMFGYVDGCTMSCKKDGLSNIGGFLALNDDAVAERAKQILIRSEGYTTYGGLAGYDMEAIAVGLTEVLKEDYLSYRINQIQYLATILIEEGIPIVVPPGGHAIYIDAKTMLSHIPQSEYPAWTLSLVLYLIGGIRSVEIGSVMFGGGGGGGQQQKQSDNGSGIEKKEEEVFAENELVRLAFPRRVYTKSHLDYLVEVILYINQIKDDHIRRGVIMVESPPRGVLRHFTAHFIPAHHYGTLIANDDTTDIHDDDGHEFDVVSSEEEREGT